MSNTRKLRPRERARQDQHLAAIRAQAAGDPAAYYVVTTFAEPGTMCSWCDCPWSRHEPLHHQCDTPCEAAARHVTHLGYGAPGQVTIPTCARHDDDFTNAVLATLAETRRPISLSSVRVLDEETP